MNHPISSNQPKPSRIKQPKSHIILHFCSILRFCHPSCIIEPSSVSIPYCTTTESTERCTYSCLGLNTYTILYACMPQTHTHAGFPRLMQPHNTLNILHLVNILFTCKTSRGEEFGVHMEKFTLIIMMEDYSQIIT